MVNPISARVYPTGLESGLEAAGPAQLAGLSRKL